MKHLTLTLLLARVAFPQTPLITQVGVFNGYTTPLVSGEKVNIGLAASAASITAPVSGLGLGTATDVTRFASSGLAGGAEIIASPSSGIIYGPTVTDSLTASASMILAYTSTAVTGLGTGTDYLLKSVGDPTSAASITAPVSGLGLGTSTDITRFASSGLTSGAEITASLSKGIIYTPTVTGSLGISTVPSAQATQGLQFGVNGSYTLPSGSTALLNSVFDTPTDATRLAVVGASTTAFEQAPQASGARAGFSGLAFDTGFGTAPVYFRENSPNISDVRGSVNLTYSGTYSGITYDVTINIICNAPYSCVSVERMAELVSERLQGKQ